MTTLFVSTSLDLNNQHPIDDNVAKSTVEPLLGRAMEGNGRTFTDAAAQILIAA